MTDCSPSVFLKKSSIKYLNKGGHDVTLVGAADEMRIQIGKRIWNLSLPLKFPILSDSGSVRDK